MQYFVVDLHIHSLLSPCADLSMSPQMIANRAKMIGLDAIAVCDHNSLYQLPELKACCESLNIYLFLGVEITTQEEVHVVALLPNLEVCRQMQEFIDTHIMRLPYSPDLLGDQIWVDSEEQIAGEYRKSVV